MKEFEYISGWDWKMLQDTYVVKITPSTNIIDKYVEGMLQDLYILFGLVFIDTLDKGNGLGHTALIDEDTVFVSSRYKYFVAFLKFVWS